MPIQVHHAGTPGLDAALDRIRLRVESQSDESTVRTVRTIIRDVRERGDAALLDLTRKHDRVTLEADALAVEEDEIRAGAERTPVAVRTALRLAAERIRAYQTHIRGEPPPDLDLGDGARAGCRWVPLRRVGLYVPGGLAAYPSSLLMGVIPAQVAGVEEIAIATPPGPGGSLPHGLCAAIQEVGVTEVWRVGGAQAIAALAYGTGSIRPCDLVGGPGNRFVTEAKRQVYGHTAIDLLAGPSEILVLADGGANPAWVAADLLSQAEHDPLSSAILVTTDADLCPRVIAELELQIELLPRREVARGALRRFGLAIVARDLDEAVAMADRVAPEHLEVMTGDPEGVAARIRCAGAVFVGAHTPEPIGDYVAGPSHTLPTGGSARSFSGVSVHTYLRRHSFLAYGEQALRRDAPAILALARAEGLSAHARSVEIRTGSTR